jgi:glutathione S-transferase
MVLKLYGFDFSTSTRRAILILKEANIPFEFISVDLSKGEQMSPEYRAKQPFGVVPCIVRIPISTI